MRNECETQPLRIVRLDSKAVNINEMVFKKVKGCKK